MLIAQRAQGSSKRLTVSRFRHIGFRLLRCLAHGTGRTSFLGRLAFCLAAAVSMTPSSVAAEFMWSAAGARASSSSTADLGAPLVSVTEAGLSILETAYSRLYGPGVFTIDCLSNFPLDYPGVAVAQRFRAPVSGRLASLRTYWPDGAGYAKGNGGTIRIRVFPDDSSARHFPALGAEPIATGLYRPMLSNGKHSTSRWNDLIQLSASKELVRGQIYHVVYDNLDPNAHLNWVSLNFVATVVGNGRPSRWVGAADWGALRGQLSNGAASWADYTLRANDNLYHAPLVQLNLVDGTAFGNSDMEAGNSPQKQWIARRATPVRERFMTSQDRSFGGLSFATAASVPGQLLWEVKDGERVLASGMVSEQTPSFHTIDTMGVLRWFDVSLPVPIAMTSGRFYDVVFTPQGSSAWHFVDERNGSDYDFQPPASTSDSQAQHFYNGSWIDAYHWDHAKSSRGSNWRVVLHLTP